LIVTELAVGDLDKCRRFLDRRNPEAAKRAVSAIRQHLSMLETWPHSGRPHTVLEDVRELPIPFGRSGYVALYRFDPDLDLVVVIAVRHFREAGY